MPKSDLLASAKFRCLDTFALQIGFTPRRAVVTVRGDLDLSTAPTLDNVLVALADSGHTTILLDLAGLTFLGAGGLGAIANTGGILRRAGGALTLHRPPAHARRILDITGITTRVRIEDDDADEALRADLSRVVWRTKRDDATDAELSTLVALAATAVTGADGVSISLERNGRLMTAAASNDTVLRMDDHQYATGEGPCVSAAADGEGFEIASLAEEVRWPDFVPRAIDEGIASIFSTPLVVGDKAVGALNIYSSTPRAFGEHQHELASLYAADAALVIGGGDRGSGDEYADHHISDGLRSRSVLALAQGILMARHAITENEASAVLHRSARGDGTSVLDEAAKIVSSTVPVDAGRARTDG